MEGARKAGVVEKVVARARDKKVAETVRRGNLPKGVPLSRYTITCWTMCVNGLFPTTGVTDVTLIVHIGLHFFFSSKDTLNGQQEVDPRKLSLIHI